MSDLPLTKAERRRLRREHRRQRNALVPVAPTTPALPAPEKYASAPTALETRPYAIGRGIVGVLLIGLAFALAYASVRANAWADLRYRSMKTPDRYSPP